MGRLDFDFNSQIPIGWNNLMPFDLFKFIITGHSAESTETWVFQKTFKKRNENISFFKNVEKVREEERVYLWIVIRWDVILNQGLLDEYSTKSNLLNDQIDDLMNCIYFLFLIYWKFLHHFLIFWNCLIIARIVFFFMSGLDPSFVGCYTDFHARTIPFELITTSDMTIPTCMTHCESRGYPVVGLQHGESCFCGNEVCVNNFIFSFVC